MAKIEGLVAGQDPATPWRDITVHVQFEQKTIDTLLEGIATELRVPVCKLRGLHVIDPEAEKDFAEFFRRLGYDHE